MQRRSYIAATLVTLVGLTACIQERGQIEYFRCASGATKPPPPATSNGEYSGYGLQNADGKTIFERDVLPLLQSTDTGKVYKCTVCHAGFADPKNLNQPGRIDALIGRMTLPRDDGKFMPINADQVTAEDVAVFKAWQDGGYLTAASAGEPTEPTISTEPGEPGDPTEPGVTVGSEPPPYDGDYDGESAYDKPSADAKPASGCTSTSASSGNKASY